MVVSNRGNMGLRIIVFMGAATFLFLMLMAFGLKKSLQPQIGVRVPEGAATSPFNEDRAWEDVQSWQLLLDASAKADRDAFLIRQLREAGLKMRRFDFEASPSDGTTAASSFAGIVEGTRPDILLICGVVDAPATGAANAAWLLEMARVLGGRRDGRTVWLVFLEGDSLPGAEAKDGSYPGSQHLVKRLKAQKEFTLIDAAIALNGIGDCQLHLRKDKGAPPIWIEILWNTADREGYGKFFGALPAPIPGGHLAFREAGIPALALVDDNPGGARQAPPQGGSLPQEACRESLRAVGDVIYHALAPLEGHLDETGMRIDGQ
jgi:hypothetical protein